LVFEWFGWCNCVVEWTITWKKGTKYEQSNEQVIYVMI
jgi:hypothetical protein